MYKALLVDELNPTTDLSNDCPTFGLIEYIILKKEKNTVKPNYLKKQILHHLTFTYQRYILIQVQNDNGVLKRLVPCLKCMELAF